VGPRAGLDGCGKSRPHRNSIPDRPARRDCAIPADKAMLLLLLGNRRRVVGRVTYVTSWEDPRFEPH
jgi:hypothetical protein